MAKVVINGSSLTMEEVADVARHGRRVEIAESAKELVNKSRAYVDNLVEKNRVVYGVTTGFGKFSDVHISKEDAEQLQTNLIMSHACGTGTPFPEETVRAMMLLRANALVIGLSGIRLSTIEALLAMLNNDVHPVIPEKGSLGASGDLAPLAHMILPLLGLGEAFYKGERMDGGKALEKAGLKPIRLTSKEGLALINGTPVMTAAGGLASYDAYKLMKLADVAAGLTAEALNGITDAYRKELHECRPHQGQLDTAENMLRILEGSERTTKQGEIRVQDAYALRCVPQIHGASRDALRYVGEKVNIEINAVTDNPIILPQYDAAISGGNFHGQPMALPFDFLGIAAAEIANVSERRIERLVNPALSEGLPAFLSVDGGLNSGFMIVQYAAAALVSENKVLAHPASVDSIPSSANQEDHVSMGTIAARKARDITDNATRVLAMELVAACQAIDLSKRSQGKKLGKGTKAAYDAVRAAVTKVEKDRVMYFDFDKIVSLIKDGSILKAVEDVIGELK
jgi:histidine ammonia-lyase